MKKHLALTVLAAIIASAAIASPTIPTLNLEKIKPSELLMGPYSYFVPPYSYYYFHNMDKLGFRLDWIRRFGPVYPLHEQRAPFTTNYTYRNKTYTLKQYYKRNAVLGFLVLKNNQIMSERYFHGANVHSRFLSNSVQKSFTAMLFGIALDEGKINSIDDPVIKYLPELRQSGYNHVTLKQVLEMATGIDATENGLDPRSSIHQFAVSILRGKPSFLDYLKTLKAKSNVKPGTVFDYESVNTQVLGLVIEKATGMPLNKYMQEKIWRKIGAESDAFLFRAKTQPDQAAFGCLSVALRDYARFGLTMMNDGTLGGVRVFSSSWVKQATTPKIAKPLHEGELGYGYQWWIPYGKDGAYKALGIFGQIIYINPAKHIVIVETSAWPEPDMDARWEESAKVMDAIVAKLSQ